MALSHVASSAWVSGTASITPTLPTGTANGDLVIITLVSKYDDAVLGGDPAGWTGVPVVFNTGRAAGNDTGNLRARAFYRTYDGVWTMPPLAPTPNNVSTTKASTYRIAAGRSFLVDAELVKDDTVGTPLLLAATRNLGLTSGDILHWDIALNGDAPTWGTSTVSAAGATLGANTQNVADAATTLGTDMRMRSQRNTVTAGTATGNPQVSTALAGTTTNAVGVGLLFRIRESPAAPTPRTGTATSALPVMGQAATGTHTSTSRTGTATSGLPVMAQAATGTHTAPKDPDNLVATQTGSSVVLTWNVSTLPGATHIDIHRRPGTSLTPFDPQTHSTRIARIATGIGTYTDNNPGDGDWTYQVFSVVQAVD